MKDLIALEQKQLPELYVKNGFDPLIDKVKEKIVDFVADVSTDKGRKEVAGIVKWIRDGRVEIEKRGLSLTNTKRQEIKEEIDAMIAERKRVKEAFSGLEIEVGQPLTDYKEEKKREKKAELERVQDIKNRIGQLRTWVKDDWQNHPEKSVDIKKAIKKLEGIKVDEFYQEFKGEAEAAKKERLEALGNVLEVAQGKEEIAAEQKRLADDKLERERIKRENDIKDKAAADATKKAEETAQKKIDAGKKEKHRLEFEAEAAKKRLKEQAKKDKLDKQTAAYEKKRDIEQAKKDEREKVEKEAADKKEAYRIRTANRKHRMKIHSEMKKSLLANGISGATADHFMVLVSQGKIKNLSVKY